LIPKVLCPLLFRNEADSNIRAIDQYGSQTKVDPSTGETIQGKTGNDLLHGAVGVVWSDNCVTMTRAVARNGSKRDLLLANAAQMMSLVPLGRTLELHTCSNWLAGELAKMVGRVACHFSGELSWGDVPLNWKRILEHVLDGSGRGLMMKAEEEEIPSYLEIAKTYCAEKI
jgi:hypothetical protein